EPKVESAKRTLEALNPDVKVVAYQERLTSANIDRIIKDYDVVVDGADNFPTRYLLNDASIKHRIPVVHGSIYRFEGQVTVFKPFEGPCYRCLFPEPPPPELSPSCAEAGVLGVLPGVIGTIQATEALKLVLGIGDSLVRRCRLSSWRATRPREARLRRPRRRLTSSVPSSISLTAPSSTRMSTTSPAARRSRRRSTRQRRRSRPRVETPTRPPPRSRTPKT